MLKMTRKDPIEAQDMNNLVIATINQFFATQAVSCMNLSVAIKDLYNITTDWHDIAASLDQLCTMKKLTHAGFSTSGLNCYRIAK